MRLSWRGGHVGVVGRRIIVWSLCGRRRGCTSATGQDEGKHALQVNFVDADGRPIANFPPIPVEVALPEDMHFGTRNFIVNIQQLKFDNPGLYSIDVLLDGRPQARIPLLVRYNPPAAAA